jgi:hypothetical protein
MGCDLHARRQTLAMLDTETGEVVNRTLLHEGNEVREFYSELPCPELNVSIVANWCVVAEHANDKDRCS